MADYRQKIREIVGFINTELIGEERRSLYEPEKVAKGITKILMKNITTIKQIEKVILDAIIR